MTSTRPPDPCARGAGHRRIAARAFTAARAVLAAWLAAAALVLLVPHAAPAQTDVKLTVEKTGMVRVNLVVGEFTVHGTSALAMELGAAARDVVKNDLFYSGLFNQEDLRSPVPADGKALTALLDSLKTQGHDVLLAGDVTIEAGAPHLETRLYDTASGKIIDRSMRLLTRPEVRARAHELSDQVVLLLTGERGIATTKIAFVSNRTGAKELYLMDYDGENVTQLTRNHSINLSPEWAPSGDLLASVSYLKGNADIFILRPGQDELVPFAVSPGLDSDPVFSPRGDRVAFTRAVNGNPDVYVGTVQDGHLGDITRLTRESGVDCCPTWAPGGSEIAFVSDRSGTPQIYVMQADGTNVHRITFLGKYNASPAWSPNGDRIAFASREDNIFSIFTVQPNGENLMRLTAAGGDFEDPSWSPDGRHLAVMSRREGRGSIYLLGADGSTLQLVSRGAGEDSGPSWGPWPPAVDLSGAVDRATGSVVPAPVPGPGSAPGSPASVVSRPGKR